MQIAQVLRLAVPSMKLFVCASLSNVDCITLEVLESLELEEGVPSCPDWIKAHATLRESYMVKHQQNARFVLQLQGYHMDALQPLTSSELMYPDSLLQPPQLAMQGLHMNHGSPSQDPSHQPAILRDSRLRSPSLGQREMGSASLMPEDGLPSDGPPNAQPEQDMENFINIFLQVSRHYLDYVEPPQLVLNSVLVACTSPLRKANSRDTFAPCCFSSIRL